MLDFLTRCRLPITNRGKRGQITSAWPIIYQEPWSTSCQKRGVATNPVPKSRSKKRSKVPQTSYSSDSLSCGTLQLGRFSLKRFVYLDVYVLRGLSIPKSDSLQGSLDLLVLKILSRRARLHGYAIMSAIQDISGEVLRVEEGSLYPALHRMEEAGWIRAEWITKDSGKRARMYELTAAGKKQLGAEESRWQAVTSAVTRVLREA